MIKRKAKREIATKNIRIYPTTLLALQETSAVQGKAIARIVHDLVLEDIKKSPKQPTSV